VGGGRRFPSRFPGYPMGASHTGSRRRTDFECQGVAQFSHRIRAARFGPNCGRCHFQGFHRDAAGGLRQGADDDGRQGWKCINFLRNVSPFMRGISISSVRTSGRRERILSRATYGSGADPTTARSGSSARASLRIPWTMADVDDQYADGASCKHREFSAPMFTLRRPLGSCTQYVVAARLGAISAEGWTIRGAPSWDVAELSTRLSTAQRQLRAKSRKRRQEFPARLPPRRTHPEKLVPGAGHCYARSRGAG
jgi:hypothetical protein